MPQDDIVLEELMKLSKSVFVNREVLRPDYVPEKLPHREEQIRRLTQILAPLVRGERPSNVFIYGLTGTGKTAVTRYVLMKIREYVRGRGPGFTYVYVNCRHDDTTYRVLARIADALGERVPFTGLSTAEVFSRVRAAIERFGGVVVVVLDEIDFLVKKHGDELLYRLTRINGELRRGKVTLIGITNDISFVERLDARVMSSLGEVELVFPPYTAEQLTDILRERAEKAFRPGTLAPGVIEYCAAVAAKEHGDARRALDLLRVAGEIAEREGAEKVTVDHVRRARQEIELDTVSEVIKTLPYHGKLVLAALLVLGGKAQSTGDLYIAYRQICRALGTEPVTQRRVSDLVGELDMLGIVTARVISKGRYGKTRVIALTVSPETVRKVLSAEEGLGEVLT